MAPFGFILDGLTDSETTFVDNKGDYWTSATDNKWNTDEYGDMAYMWEYK
jgi:hypothetical protein